MKLNKKLPLDIVDHVRTEVLLTFEIEEIKALTWEDFWDQIDALNFFEEEWRMWLSKGIKSVYKVVFNEIKNG